MRNRVDSRAIGSSSRKGRRKKIRNQIPNKSNSPPPSYSQVNK